MSLARRTSRKIIVDGTAYRWTASGDSGWINVVVQHASGDGAKFHARAPYFDWYDAHWYEINAPVSPRLPNVTPAIVRRLIEAGRAAGWNPATAGPPFQLPKEASEAAVAEFLVE